MMEKVMKKVMIGLLGLVVVGGYLFSQYWYYLPGIISEFVSPIGENQPVTWEQGPSASPSKDNDVDRLPNIVLIVVDDLGFNDIKNMYS